MLSTLRVMLVYAVVLVVGRERSLDHGRMEGP